VRDMNPNSPTRWGGPFGKVPRYYSSPFVSTVAQATTVATTILSTALGLNYVINLRSVPNPALEPLDVIRVKYPTGTTDERNELHIIDTLTIPLTYDDPLEIKTRRQDVILFSTQGT